MMIPGSAQIYLILLLSAGLLHAELRTFTNDFGDSIEAELIELKDNGTIVTMRLKNGRTIDAAISAFSLDDKKYIREWWKKESAVMQVLNAKARVGLEVIVRTKTDDMGYKTSSSERQDVVKIFLPEIIVDNLASQKFTNNEIRVVFFAYDLRSKAELLIVSEKSIKTDLQERKKESFKIEAFRLRHYGYESNYSDYEYQRGYKYAGYAVMVKNSKGEVILEEASKKEFLNKDLIFKCKTGEIYDKSFEYKLKEDPNSPSSSSSSSSSYYW